MQREVYRTMDVDGRMTPAYGYLRVSGKGQIEGDGFTRQREAIRRYAAANDIRIVKWFEERGVSGTKELDHRPALVELLEALASNGAKLVLIEKLDRLARDLMIQETIIGDLRKRGFSLISVAEPDLLQDDPSRKLMRQIFGAIAEYEKTMIVLKLRGARKRTKDKDGRCEGRKPYGFHPDEAEALTRMVEMRNSGSTFEQIADALATAGVKPRQGDSWHPYAISRIVKRVRCQITQRTGDR